MIANALMASRAAPVGVEVTRTLRPQPTIVRTSPTAHLITMSLGHTRLTTSFQTTRHCNILPSSRRSSHVHSHFYIIFNDSESSLFSWCSLSCYAAVFVLSSHAVATSANEKITSNVFTHQLPLNFLISRLSSQSACYPF